MGFLEQHARRFSQKELLREERQRNWANLIQEGLLLTGTPYPSDELSKLTVPIRKADLSTWEHSIKVGLVMGELGRKFYGFPTFVGRVIGQVHDVGKLPVIDIVKKPGFLTPEERIAVNKHVEYSEQALAESGFPNIARVVKGHHTYGQPNPYPEGFVEKDIFFRNLQTSLALADKVVANLEVRPETNIAGIINKIYEEDNIYGKLMRNFPPEVWLQIEHLRTNLFEGEEILPVVHRIDGEMEKYAEIPSEIDYINPSVIDRRPQILAQALILFRQMHSK